MYVHILPYYTHKLYDYRENVGISTGIKRPPFETCFTHVRIGSHVFTLPALGAVVRAAAGANSS